MNEQEIKSDLCYYDPENPNNNLGAFDDEDRPQPRNKCSCDNCFYGRDKLAMQLLEARRERDEAREKAERYRIEANSIMLQRDEARSLTEHQWLLKVGSRLFVAGCKSDGIIDSLDEIIRERDELRKQNSKLISIAERAINIGRIIK